MVVHADGVDQQPDMGFSQRQVSSPQLLADQLAEVDDRILTDPLRSSCELKCQDPFTGVQLRDVPSVLGELLDEQGKG